MKNIVRNKGRNLIIAVILLGIISSTMVAFSLNATTKGIIENYRNRFGTEVTIERNMKKVQDLINSGQSHIKFEDITPRQYMKFGESEYIQSSLFTSTMSGISSLKAIDEDLANDDNSLEVYIDDDGKVVSPSFKLIGNSDLEALEDFKDEKRKIIVGNIYKDKNECVISQDLAKLNGVNVGDTIEIKYPGYLDKDPIKLIVSGIYLDITEEYNDNIFKNPLVNRRNEILCHFDLVNENAMFLDVQARYFLKSPDMLDDFSKDLTKMGLPDIYEATTDSSTYKKIVEPVESLSSITVIFICVVLILGTIILMLLNNMSIRERKYEIGVLRAIGMKKMKIAFGLLSESLVITVLCLAVGLMVGQLVATPISHIVLEKQIAVYDEQVNQEDYWGNSESQNSENIELLKELDVVIEKETLIKVSVVAMILALSSSVIGIVYMTRFEPVKILSERG